MKNNEIISYINDKYPRIIINSKLCSPETLINKIAANDKATGMEAIDKVITELSKVSVEIKNIINNDNKNNDSILIGVQEAAEAKENAITATFTIYHNEDSEKSNHIIEFPLGLPLSNQLSHIDETTPSNPSKQETLIDNKSTFFQSSISQPIEKKDVKPRYKIMIVDDNLLNLKTLSVLAKKYDPKPETAENGKIAVDKYKKEPKSYNLILMDMQMPVMDGIEATKEIRQYENDNNIPAAIIIFCTAATEEIPPQIYQADGKLSKPIKPLDLESVIKKHSDYLIKRSQELCVKPEISSSVSNSTKL